MPIELQGPASGTSQPGGQPDNSDYLAYYSRTDSFQRASCPLSPRNRRVDHGAVVMAYVRATLARRISAEQLEQAILVLLLVIVIALIVEGFLLQAILSFCRGQHAGMK